MATAVSAPVPDVGSIVESLRDLAAAATAPGAPPVAKTASLSFTESDLQFPGFSSTEQGVLCPITPELLGRYEDWTDALLAGLLLPTQRVRAVAAGGAATPVDAAQPQAILPRP